jgi:hypothetical protein
MHSPILNIPVEIIREILSHLASPVLYTSQNPGTPFPWVLGHICSEWRAIFLSMKPQFWSRISIRYEEENFDAQIVRHIKEMVKFFLNRNRADVITFDYMVLAMTVTINTMPEDMHPVLEMLVEESNRWESASITIIPQDVHILRRIRNRLPFLRKLVVTTVTHIPGLPSACDDMFKHAPLLRDVTLSGPTWKLNWPALTTVALRTSVNNTLAILPRIPNVEILSLSPYRSRINDSCGLITLPRLNTLIVDREIPDFLDMLKVPKLENLTILCNIRHSRPRLITSFLSRSSCSIRYLSLNVIDGESLADILRYAPHIESLKFTLHNKWRGPRSLAFFGFPENHDDECDPSRGLLAHHLKSLTIEAMDWPFMQEEISMLIHIVKCRTIIFDKNKGIMKERFQNLTVDMPYTLAFPNELTELIALCTEVGVAFQHTS